MDKSLKDALAHSLLTAKETDPVYDSAIKMVSSDALASSIIEEYLTNCGAVEFKCSDLTTLDEVFEAYFNLTPPFADRKKRKEEFPDATVLFAIEAYAKKFDKKL